MQHTAHTPGANPDGLGLTAWLTGFYFVVELGIGLYTGSVSVLSDAFHTFSAVGGVLLAIVAARIARRPVTAQRSFGYGRAEIIGALLNGIFLLVMALLVLWMGYHRLRSPIELPTMPMLAAAIGGLVVELISLRALYASQAHDLNVRGAFWHVLQTFVGSLIIIVAVVVIELTGFVAIDPILGMAFGVVLLIASWGIMRDALVILMEATPGDVDLKAVDRLLSAISGVVDVHHLHAWTITSGQTVVSAHIRTDNTVPASSVLREAHSRLADTERFAFATVQVEDHCTNLNEPTDLDFKRPGTSVHDGH